MPLREILGKALGFGFVALACIGGGLLALYGPHAYNDYFNAVLGYGLILIGLGVGALGTLLVAFIIRDSRERAREHEVHVTPRPGPLAPPPPWGMGDVGRPGVRHVGEPESAPRGGGGPRVMSVAVSNIDAPLLLGVLLLWTVGFLIWLAPR